jgi:hypothetical protein
MRINQNRCGKNEGDSLLAGGKKYCFKLLKQRGG